MSKTNLRIENQLNEAFADYFRQSVDVPVSGKSGKDITYTEFLSDKLLIMYVIRKGLPYPLFELIQQYTPFPEREWADFLDVSEKSLQRYKSSSNFRFKSIHSEKIIEMAEVTTLGIDVFGSKERFHLWLETPNFALGNMEPMQFLKDSYGKEMIISELTRINHGILV